VEVIISAQGRLLELARLLPEGDEGGADPDGKGGQVARVVSAPSEFRVQRWSKASFPDLREGLVPAAQPRSSS